MAAQQPPQGEPTASPHPMAFDRLQAIGAAAGDEAAAGAQQGGDPLAIEADQAQQQQGQGPGGSQWGSGSERAKRGPGANR